MSEKTITVHGTVYDRKTGMPLRVERSHTASHSHAASMVHATPQKSRTLHRKYVHLEKKAQLLPETPAATITVHKKPTKPPVHTISPSVSRFHTPVAPYNKTPVMSDIAPTKHHLAQAVHQRTAKPIPTMPKPSHVLKKEAIAAATATMPARRSKLVKPDKPHHLGRALSVASTALALLLMGGYLTYLNMPALSTRVAASQAGINARYPAYLPSGYSLNGPVAYQQGNVTMKFAANAGPAEYTISQSKSGWDSSAVLENYITPKAGSNYMTDSINGLTIYTYDSNAAWVNGGILYTITGNAPLSTDQVERIATSM